MLLLKFIAVSYAMLLVEDSGTKIVKLDAKTQKEMRKQAQPVYDAIKKNISRDIYNAYLSGAEK